MSYAPIPLVYRWQSNLNTLELNNLSFCLWFQYVLKVGSIHIASNDNGANVLRVVFVSPKVQLSKFVDYKVPQPFKFLSLHIYAYIVIQCSWILFITALISSSIVRVESDYYDYIFINSKTCLHRSLLFFLFLHYSPYYSQ